MKSQQRTGSLEIPLNCIDTSGDLDQTSALLEEATQVDSEKRHARRSRLDLFFPPYSHSHSHSIETVEDPPLQSHPLNTPSLATQPTT